MTKATNTNYWFSNTFPPKVYELRHILEISIDNTI